MKKVMIVAVLLLSMSVSKANFADTAHLYNPLANAEAGIAKAVAQAKKEHKFVFIQAGGNWCIWCLRFNNFITQDAQIDSLVKANFIVYHLNYSKENFNLPVFAKYGFPQRFGFPVFIILDGDGHYIHTQNSAYLEENKGYNKEKVMDFFSSWTPAALDPKNYTNPM
ncbi:MAG TPA: thioredoxin family protein [Chitinophagaceae bacterium]|nr:thioredoxin family protein [Chitinophagaceae bacterium]